MARSLDVRLEWLRAVSIIAVVVIHLVAPTMNAGEYGSIEWYIASILSGICRWSVPVFIMISGALLMTKPVVSLRSYYIKVWWRVVVPMLIFTAFYMFWRTTFGVTSYEGAWNFLVDGRPYYHLHFMFIILGLQVIHPLLQRLAYLGEQRFTQLVVICMIGMTLIGLVTTYTGYELQFYSRWMPFVGYYLAGHLVYQYRLYSLVRSVRLAVGVVASITVMSAMLMLAASRGNEELGLLFYATNMPLVMLVSVMVFMLGLRMPLPGGQRVWLGLASASYGIYLLHPWFLEVLRYAFARDNLFANILALPIVVGVSWLAVVILRRRHAGRVILGEHHVKQRIVVEKNRPQVMTDDVR